MGDVINSFRIMWHMKRRKNIDSKQSLVRGITMKNFIHHRSRFQQNFLNMT